MGRYGIEGRVALVTGGAKGIGEAIATLSAQEGAKVVVMDYDGTALDATVARLRAEGYEVTGVVGDVSKAADCKRAVDTAVETYGTLNILFPNAGVPLIASVKDVEIADVDRVVDINLKGMIYICKYAIPELIKAGGGAIVTTGSEMAFAADPANPIYDASKAGVVMLTKSMALDLIQYKIRVNSVCPGVTNTPLLQQEVETSPDPVQREAENNAWAPIGRVADPMEIAHPALFLASDMASFMVASTVLVDGGFTAK
ncbi:MAG TPA: glucose 1-dehydrogenase [Dictyobacter sp.]|jgi:NAD(P)-dependent dehydrogenase (short-subunit alcohol dehydrogenase family)|nr:glucose 1-dehydrogenase [Dictyobacter sp.]